MQQKFLCPVARAEGLEHYIQTVFSYPVLSIEQEQLLTERFCQHADLEAARSLILSHLRFVVHIARSYTGYGLPQADLIQEGNIGLMKALKRFDPKVGVRLISFAVHWIKAEIYEYVVKNWRLVKIATTKAQRKLFFNLKKLQHRFNGEHAPIAQALGVEPHEVAQMEARLSAPECSFDADSMQDALVDPSSDFVDRLEATESSQGLMKRLAEAVAQLDERSRDIIQARWFHEQRETLQVLAQRHQLSIERVRQLEQRAMQKLKVSLG